MNTPLPTPSWRLQRNPFGRLVLTDEAGDTHVGVVPVRAFPIGAPDEVPAECGVMLVERGALRVAREAPRRAVERLPFHVWMALAKAGPAWREDDPSQQAL